VLSVVAAGLAVALSGGVARADTYSLFFNKTFSDTDPQPANAAPWLTAVFEDVDEDLDTVFDYVKLTLAAPGLAAGEFSADWYFNIGENGAAEATKIAGMTAIYLSGTAPSDVNLSQNAYQADGDGKYDLNITFPQGNSKTLANGQTSAYKLTGVDVAFLKDRWSLKAGGKGPFLAAAHIQGLATGNSVWVHASMERDPNIVPEAGLLQFAAFAGLGALALLRRRRA